MQLLSDLERLSFHLTAKRKFRRTDSDVVWSCDISSEKENLILIKKLLCKFHGHEFHMECAKKTRLLYDYGIDLVRTLDFHVGKTCVVFLQDKALGAPLRDVFKDEQLLRSLVTEPQSLFDKFVYNFDMIQAAGLYPDPHTSNIFYTPGKLQYIDTEDAEGDLWINNENIIEEFICDPGSAFFKPAYQFEFAKQVEEKFRKANPYKSGNDKILKKSDLLNFLRMNSAVNF